MKRKSTGYEAGCYKQFLGPHCLFIRLVPILLQNSGVMFIMNSTAIVFDQPSF